MHTCACCDPEPARARAAAEAADPTPPMGVEPAPDCRCHLCEPPDATLDEVDARTVRTVSRHGWQVVAVSGGNGPGFAHTVGLPHRAGHPELLMSGLDHDLMRRCLDHLAEKVLDGDAFTCGQVLEDVLTGVPVLLEQVRPAALVDTVRRSRWFHRRRVDAMQVVWPDTAARFGWQPGADDDTRRGQPASWRVPAGRVGMLAPDPMWPLPTPPDTPAVACRHIIDQGAWAASVERFVINGRDEWTVTCFDDIHHDFDPWPDEDDPSSGMTTTSLAHLVRAVPSLATLADLPDGGDAFRLTPDQSWYVSRGWGRSPAGQTGLSSPPPCHSAQETFQSP